MQPEARSTRARPRSTTARHGARPRRAARADRLRTRPRLDRGDGRAPAARLRCVCNVHTVMASAEDPELRARCSGSSVNVPDGQPLVWAMDALGHSLEDRVYGPELMVRACARTRPSGQRAVSVRRPQPGRARAARAEPPPAVPGHPDRRRLLAAAPPADRRGGARRRSSEINRSRRGRRVDRDRRAQAGEMDGAHAPAAPSAGADRRRGGVRLPRRPRAAGPPWLQEPGSSGRIGSPTSRGGCGAATCATTRASVRASRPASSRRRAQRRRAALQLTGFASDGLDR